MRKSAALLITGILLISGSALAHHSFAMFDQENPVELVGVLQEFKFTSPHTFLIVQVKDAGGGTRPGVWKVQVPARWFVTAGRAKRCGRATSLD